MAKSFISEEEFFNYLSLDNIEITIDNERYETYIEKLNKIEVQYGSEYSKIYDLSDFITFKFKDEKTAKITCFILNNMNISLSYPCVIDDTMYASSYAKILPESNLKNTLETKAKIIIRTYDVHGSNIAKRLKDVIPNLKQWIKSKLDAYEEELGFIYTSENVNEKLGIKIKGLSIYIPYYEKFALLMYFEDENIAKKYPMIYDNMRTTKFLQFLPCITPGRTKVWWESLHKSLNACSLTHKKVFMKHKEILQNIESMSMNFDYNYV